MTDKNEEQMSQSLAGDISVPSHWCKKLRWKTYPLDKDDASAAQKLFLRGTQTFFCFRTANAAGEDDGPVAPERCHSGRECYVEHPTLVMLKRAVA